MIEVAILHFSPRSGIWLRECLRATIYGGLLPLTLIGGLFFPWILLAVLVYPLQVLRIAYRSGIRDSKFWIYGLIMSISKFAEFIGIVSLIVDKLRRKRRPIIEYK